MHISSDLYKNCLHGCQFTQNHFFLLARYYMLVVMQKLVLPRLSSIIVTSHTFGILYIKSILRIRMTFSNNIFEALMPDCSRAGHLIFARSDWNGTIYGIEIVVAQITTINIVLISLMTLLVMFCIWTISVEISGRSKSFWGCLSFFPTSRFVGLLPLQATQTRKITQTHTHRMQRSKNRHVSRSWKQRVQEYFRLPETMANKLTISEMLYGCE